MNAALKMKWNQRVFPAFCYWTTVLAVVLPLALSAKLTPEQIQTLPPSASEPVDFRKDIQPLLEGSCVKCHGRGKTKGGFSLENRAAFLKGGESGPGAVSGKSAESRVVELVSGLDAENIMPAKGTKLTPKQLGILRAWIDQGLPWDADVHFGRLEPRNLLPHAPQVPAEGGSHPLDRLLLAYQKAQSSAPATALVDDRTFARRVSLDVVGLIPESEAVDAFMKDSRSDKRERWVDRMLADHQGYAAHWFSFWNDLLRNDYRGTGFIDSGRKQISTWLHSALATNLPYDQFVRDLVHPIPATEGFTKGIVWRGVVNASVTPPMQAAQNISQVFMGVNLKCASCHDSFINDWGLADSYGLAAIYSDEPLELVECDKPTGRKAVARFIYPQLGEIGVTQSRTNRTEQLARVMTDRKNGRLTRTIVNRLWERLFGRGLVESVDDLDQVAWSPDILDWLAEDLADHGYDLKRTLRSMLTSRAYQMTAVDLGERSGPAFVFRGPGIRRMSSEQFRDALGRLTGIWYTDSAAELDLATGGDDKTQAYAAIPDQARWIWATPGAAESAPAGEVFFRKTFTLEALPERATVVALADDSFTLHVNGTQVIAGKERDKAPFADLLPHLKKGQNLIAVQAANAAAKEKEKDKPAPPNPAGLFVLIRMESGAILSEVFTDSSWLCATNSPTDWKQPDFGVSRWVPASALVPVGGGSWSGKAPITRALSLAAMHGHIRSSLVASDPLLTSLGRPPREQVVTVRASAATTLQALELSNGETLSALLTAGARLWMASKPVSSGALARDLYLRALSRPPTETESSIAGELLGAVPDQPRVEDLLWAIAMLPEFQLVY